MQFNKENNILFSHAFNVRIDDINYGNHLCHTKFLALAHNTRALFLKENNLSESNCYGTGLIMLGLNIEYRNQCSFNDLVEIHMYLKKIDKIKIEFLYKIVNITLNKLAATMNTVMGCFDYNSKKLTKIPKEFEALLLPYLPN